jgi:hypothetical protein
MMGDTPTTKDGYQHDGHTVEITQAITEEQFRRIEEILGHPPARFKDWAETYHFSAPDTATAERLCEYLRGQKVRHAIERRETHTPAERPAGRGGKE